jgi:hypothetical protein
MTGARTLFLDALAALLAAESRARDVARLAQERTH